MLVVLCDDVGLIIRQPELEAVEDIFYETGIGVAAYRCSGGGWEMEE